MRFKSPVAKIFAMLLVFLCMCQEEETAPPIISGFKVDKATVRRGDKVTVSFDVESEARVKSITFGNTQSLINLPFDDSRSAQTITAVYQIHSANDFGAVTLVLSVLNIKNQTTTHELVIQVEPGEAPTVTVGDEILQGQPGQTVKVKVKIAAVEGVDSLNVYLSNKLYKAFKSPTAGEFTYDFVIPADEAYTGSQLTLNHVVVDKLKRRSAPASKSVAIKLPAYFIFAFAPAASTNGIVAIGKDRANNSVTFYGDYATNGELKSMRSLAIEKTSVDTVYYFQFDAEHRIVAAFAGSRDGSYYPQMLKFSYPSDKIVTVSAYNYNWTSKTGTLVSQLDVDLTTNGYRPVFSSSRTADIRDTPAYKAVRAWVPTAARVVRVAVGGFVLASMLPKFALAIGVGTAIMIADELMEEVHASESVYYTGLPPKPTAPGPSQSPTTGTNETQCGGVNITFDAKMDHEGTILVFGTSGGSLPYTYSVDDSPFQQSEGFVKSYTDGSYKIYAKDSKGCIGGRIIALKRQVQCAPLTVLSKILADGKIEITASEGKAPYRYKLNGGEYQESNVFSGPYHTGEYLIGVMDASQCRYDETKKLTRNCPINVTGSISGAGAITLEATGGTAPYQYAVNGGSYQSSPSFPGTFANGTYEVKVKDATQCEMIDDVALTKNCNITIAAFLNGDNSISIQAGGGKSPYTYAIDHTAFQASALFVGPFERTSHTVKVKDAEGCEQVQTMSFNCTILTASDTYAELPPGTSQGTFTSNGIHYNSEFYATSLSVQACENGPFRISFYAVTKGIPTFENPNASPITFDKGLVTLSVDLCADLSGGMNMTIPGWQVRIQNWGYPDNDIWRANVIAHYRPTNWDTDTFFHLPFKINTKICGFK